SIGPELLGGPVWFKQFGQKVGPRMGAQPTGGPLMVPKTCRRVVLARRPPGEPAETDSRIEEIPVPEPGPNEALVRVIYLSLDPYMRGRMRDLASYAAPVGVGEVMTGGTVGEVVRSNHPRFKAGDIVEDRLRLQGIAPWRGP